MIIGRKPCQKKYSNWDAVTIAANSGEMIKRLYYYFFENNNIILLESLIQDE